MKARAVVAAMAMMSAWATGARGTVDIETVPVRNAGNSPDTRYESPGYGGVPYAYNIGKYEVTAGQYCEFLNAVATTDTYGLYNPEMDSDSYGCQITQNGTPGSYTYSFSGRPSGTEGDWTNRPVNYVSFWDACRFANWLHNGQRSGAQGPGTTETGAYTLDGYNGDDGRSIDRNADWNWAVTSEDEWYKAAHHQNDGDTGNYFDYPTGSNSVPSNDLIDPDPGNNATFWDSGDTIGSPYYRTEAGAHENSDSPYGTFDQAGNVWEWNEAILSGSSRGLRGGSFYSHEDRLRASFRVNCDEPSHEGSRIGFRVCEVPEPATLALLALGGLALVRRRKR